MLDEGSIELQNGLTTGYNFRLEMFDVVKNTENKLIVGRNCKMGDNCLFTSKNYISNISH